MEDFYIGEKVHYKPFETCDETQVQNGIVKYPEEDEILGYITVVYSCNNDWDDYMNYEGELTPMSKIGRSWK